MSIYKRPGMESGFGDNLRGRNSENKKENPDELKQRINATLLYLHHRFTEEGDPGHIITERELSVALGINSKNIIYKIHSAYTRSTLLNDILHSLELPHKIIKE